MNGPQVFVGFSPEYLERALRGLPGGGRWVVGFSGGADSTALLHALAALDGFGRELLAVHVHHGLQTQADAWAEFCAATAAELGVPFRLEHVCVTPSGQGLEAAAREARYAALAACMERGDVLLTAHHRGDQAETLLLQLLRGAGPAGLAAMPELAPFDSGWHARPLLNQTREALRAYLRARQLRWIDDPSNDELTANRNYLRHRVMPQLQERWPETESILAAAAQRQAQTLELTLALGRMDIEQASGSEPATLSVSALRKLDRARLHNVLRVWLSDKGLSTPSTARLEQVRACVLEAAADASPLLCWPGGEMRRYRDELHAMPPLPPHDSTRVFVWESLSENLQLPSIGRTLSLRDLHTDLSACAMPVSVRFRRGGERCRIQGAPHTRALKTLFQDAGVPPWVRDRIPLLYVGEQLREVIGFWLCDAQPSKACEEIDE